MEQRAPALAFDKYASYVARVKSPFACPAYTEPFGMQGRAVKSKGKYVVYRAGEKFSIIATHFN